jgi:hypothetical protein
MTATTNSKLDNFRQALRHTPNRDAVLDAFRRAINDPAWMLDVRHMMGLNQAEFWGMFSVTQSGGCRYEAGRKLPKPLAQLMHFMLDSVKSIEPPVSADPRILEFVKLREAVFLDEMTDDRAKTIMFSLGEIISEKGWANFRCNVDIKPAQLGDQLVLTLECRNSKKVNDNQLVVCHNLSFIFPRSLSGVGIHLRQTVQYPGFNSEQSIISGHVTGEECFSTAMVEFIVSQIGRQLEKVLDMVQKGK